MQELEAHYVQSLLEFSQFVDLLLTDGTVSAGASATIGTNSAGVAGGPGSSNPAGASSKILIGKVLHGRLAVGDTLLLGPTCLTGNFLPVIVTSVRLNNVPVRYAAMGQTATFRLARVPLSALLSGEYKNSSLGGQSGGQSGGKMGGGSPGNATAGSPSVGLSLAQEPPSAKENSSSIPTVKKRTSSVGLVLLSSSLQPLACREFSAEVHIVNHPSSVRIGYEPVVHIGSVRQAATVVAVERVGHLWSREVSAGVTSPREVLYAAVQAPPPPAPPMSQQPQSQQVMSLHVCALVLFLVCVLSHHTCTILCF